MVVEAAVVVAPKSLTWIHSWPRRFSSHRLMEYLIRARSKGMKNQFNAVYPEGELVRQLLEPISLEMAPK